jgi:hypothetical protein
VATLWLSRAPFSAGDLERLRAIASERGFHVLMQPGALPEQPLLRALAAQPSQAALASWSSEQALDLTPPSDDRPFFFNMLKARDFWTDRAQIDQLDLPFLGNLQATQTLIYSILVSLLLTLAALLLPTLSRVHALRGLQAADAGAALGYFALIGLGFMFVEIGLLSRLNVFLGHPTLSLAVLLGGLILATGAGSLLSGRIDVVANRRWARLYPLLPALAVLAVTLLLPPLLRACEAAANPLRIALALGLLLPTAVGMGLCFPLGLRLCDAMEERSLGRSPALGPWLYGINGAFGVCASGLALATSIMWGISTTLLIGAACYALLPLATRRLSAPERQ